MRSNKSYNKKDDCKHDHFKKKSDKAMHNDQSSSAGNSSKRRSQSCSRSPSRSCSCSWSCSRSSSRSYSNHHVDQDDHKPSAAPKQRYSPKHGYLYSSKSDADAFIARTKAILCLPPSPLQKQRRSAPRNGSVPVYVFVPDREPDRLTDSHVKLDILVDTQESFSTSYHRIALEYDEDTLS
jgi:hypothetical protein